MIGEIGHFAMIVALMTALVQAWAGLVGARQTRTGWVQVVTLAAHLQFILLAAAFAALTIAYVVSDFSIAVVAAHSHTAKPLLYKFTGVWGNHEGSILLWILILALYGAVVAHFGRGLPERFYARVLGIQALIGVGFLLFSLLTSNPFARLAPAPLEGEGLNPLLQDPGLAFHPPMLYLGYVGFSVAFSFAVAALLEGRVDAAWARWVRPWTLLAWSFLTGGIALGSWWAYYELGWGGWWFWDPVENASLMPWLAGTALVHSAIVVERRDTLKSWTILLAIVAFSLSLLGTFIVRSGVLNSVHAFASDPARGIFILAFLALVTGGSLVLFALRASALQPGGAFAPLSREGSLLFNNLFLAAATGTVLFGTLFPMFADAFGYKVSVAAPYFNAVFIPLMAPMIALMAVGPLLPWKQGRLSALAGRLVPMVGALFVALLVVGLLARSVSFHSLLGVGLGVWLAAGVVNELAARAGAGRRSLLDVAARLAGLPRAVWGMACAHMGVALLVVGITASITWEREEITLMAIGDERRLGDFIISLEGVRSVQGPNYSAIEGAFKVRGDRGSITTLTPQIRQYDQPPARTTEAAIYPLLSGDIYAVIGEKRGGEDGQWAVRLYHKPLIAWIWLGAGMMLAGGLIAASDRRGERRGGEKARPMEAEPSP